MRPLQAIQYPRRMTRLGAPAVALLALACILLCGAVRPAPAAAFTRGFADDVWFDASGAQWVPKTVATGAKSVLLEVDWAPIEPNAPVAGENPTSPSDPAYNFAAIDAVLRKFRGTGISATLLVTDAPRWAQGPGGTPDLYAYGAWEPNATALGQFATALARRYTGSFPDPLNKGQHLPRVRYYQAWAEANINIHLSPQWLRDANGNWQPAAPDIYAKMLNAFYAGVKSASTSDVVIASGLAPYGDLPGGRRIPPLKFLRSLLCLSDSLAATTCPDPAHFDVLAMDPYEVGPPTTPAKVGDDITVPDLGKIAPVLRRALQLGTALPRARKQLWVTEFSYDSNPPNPYAPSIAKQARWLEESMYIFWREGVSNVYWYLIRDQVGNFQTQYFSGVYFRNGQKKPSFEAYRFPLVVMASGSKATIWGISPRTGPLVVQRFVHGKWKMVFSARARAGAVFTRTVSARLHGSYRAVVGGETSLVWQY